MGFLADVVITQGKGEIIDLTGLEKCIAVFPEELAFQ